MTEISAHDLILGLVVLINALVGFMASDALGRIKKMEETYMTREESEERRAELRIEFKEALQEMREAFSSARTDMKSLVTELKTDLRDQLKPLFDKSR